jgi:polyphenol oxidase
MNPKCTEWIEPTGFAHPRVRAVFTTRDAGVSQAPYSTMNVGLHVGDAPEAVLRNRARLAVHLQARAVFMRQVHGIRVVALGKSVHAEPSLQDLEQADASFTVEPGVACVVQVADCLPVLLADRAGRFVAAVHAGWRGLAGGVIEATLEAACRASGSNAAEVQAWLGPCIGPVAFEVGREVLDAFGAEPSTSDPACFVPSPRPDGSMRWRADLPRLATLRLQRAGVTPMHTRVHGGCTVSEPARYFSYRRDATTGRHAAAICLSP